MVKRKLDNVVVDQTNKRLRRSHSTDSTGPSLEGDSDIATYRVSEQSRNILAEKGITTFFPIQSISYDAIYDGCHVLGRARTGTGKTLAFALPTIERLIIKGAFQETRPILTKVLCLTPTRELAQQVAQEIKLLSNKGTRFGVAIVIGGKPDDEQVPRIRSQGQVVVATPGRTLDYLNRGILQVNNLDVFILDEADQMLEMGFKDDVDSIFKFVVDNDKNQVQILLFTATMPDWVKRLSEEYMKHNSNIPLKIFDIVKDQQLATAGGIEHLILQCGYKNRGNLISQLINKYASGGKVIVFTETKNAANELSSSLSIKNSVIHGDIPQKARDQTIEGFKNNRFPVLIATDVASRGIHIDDIQVVIQVQPPRDVETFVHRAGRTGRAGTTGINILLYAYADVPFLKTIAKKTGVQFRRIGSPQSNLSSSLNELKKDLWQYSVTDEEHAIIKPFAKSFIEEYKSKHDTNSTTGSVVHLLNYIVRLRGYGSSNGVVSLLSGREGWKSYELQGDKKIPHKGVFFRYLRDLLKSANLPESLSTQVYGSVLRRDMMGAVFEINGTVNEKQFDRLVALTSSSECRLVVPFELPPIIDPAFESSVGNSSGNNNNNNTRNPNSLLSRRSSKR